MAEYDTIIKNGTVIDGTRLPRYRADLAIKNGRIAAIGHVAGHEGERVIDADGLIVAPGFVDLHTHYDAQLFWDPYCTLSGWHGVTSLVIGNCGFGFAPVRPEERERAMMSMTRVEAIPYVSLQQGMPWDWETYPEFLDSVERTPKGVNILPFVPLGPMLIYVMGLEAAKTREPTEDERTQLRRLFREAMAAGGCGWSAQRLPPHGGYANQRDYDGTPMATDVMSDETAMIFAEVLGELNEGFMEMTLVTGDVKRDKAHMEQLATVSGRPVLYNVVQAFAKFPDRHRRELAWLEKCRKAGVKVYGQGITVDAGFTFTFEDWNAFDDSEVWCQATLGTVPERLAKLGDMDRRPALRADMPGSFIDDWESIAIVKAVKPELKKYMNLTLGDIAKMENKHIVDVMLDTAVADDLKTVFYGLPTNNDMTLLKELIDYPWTLFGTSDGGAHTKFMTSGRYPTHAIEKFVREWEWMELEDAHWRLSTLPAMCAGFKDRGTLREGAPADVLVYDYENLRSTPQEVAEDLPGGEWRRIQKAEGYEHILVNGVVTQQGGKITGETSGKLLRHGRAE
jgi:N-acyl-D-aspartate/D-glutamate deacylase